MRRRWYANERAPSKRLSDSAQAAARVRDWLVLLPGFRPRLRLTPARPTQRRKRFRHQWRVARAREPLSCRRHETVWLTMSQAWRNLLLPIEARDAERVRLPDRAIDEQADFPARHT